MLLKEPLINHLQHITQKGQQLTVDSSVFYHWALNGKAVIAQHVATETLQKKPVPQSIFWVEFYPWFNQSHFHVT